MDAAIFTAMDAALFDVRTFSAGTNRRAIERLRAAGVPLIPIAVMTLEELAPIARQLGLAIGGSLADAEFLSRAEIPIIVPGPNGEPDPELIAKIPKAKIAPLPAPEGWAAAIEEAWTTFVSCGPRTAS